MVEALALELLITNGQNLVDEQHIGFHVHSDREPKPDIHTT